MNSISRDNVLDGITDLNSVYLLRDDDIKNRLEFLKATILTDNWFDERVFATFQLLRTVANQKGLFNPVTRSSNPISMIIDKVKSDPNRPNLPVGFPKPGAGQDGLPC